MSGVIARLWAEIGVDTSKLKTGLEGAKGTISGFASTLGTMRTVALAASGALAGVGATTGALIANWQNYTIAVGDFARKLGVTTEEASGLMEMAGDLGVGVDTLSMAFRTMANKGIEPSVEGLIAVKDALAATHDPAAKLALAQDLLGRTGGDLIAVFDQLTNDQLRGYTNSLTAAQVVTEAEYQQAILNRTKIDELSNAYESAKLAVGGFLANGLLPYIDVMKDVPIIIGRARIGFLEWRADLPGATEEFKAWVQANSDAFYQLATKGPEAHKANAVALELGVKAAEEHTAAVLADMYAEAAAAGNTELADKYRAQYEAAKRHEEEIGKIKGALQDLDGTSVDTYITLHQNTTGTAIGTYSGGQGPVKPGDPMWAAWQRYWNGQGPRPWASGGMPGPGLHSVGERGEEGMHIGPDGKVTIIPADKWARMKMGGMRPDKQFYAPEEADFTPPPKLEPYPGWNPMDWTRPAEEAVGGGPGGASPANTAFSAMATSAGLQAMATQQQTRVLAHLPQDIALAIRDIITASGGIRL